MLYDQDIREPLFEYLEENFGKIRIIEEKRVKRSRADVMMVMEAGIVGIEIKSDADTYARLTRQVPDYDRHFDYNIVAVGSSHAMHIREKVPDYWGIITIDEVDGKPDFYMLREMSRNPKNKIKYELQFLWREELAHIQEINGMYAYKQKSKKFVQEKILEKVSEDVLIRQICEELFQREYEGIEERIEEYRKQHK